MARKVKPNDKSALDEIENVFYANYFQAVLTADEAALCFGTTSLDTQDSVIYNVKVITNLPHLKRMALALTQIIANQEKMFGEIIVNPDARLTPEARERIAAVMKKRAEQAAKENPTQPGRKESKNE
jgi:hypothetical protein